MSTTAQPLLPAQLQVGEPSPGPPEPRREPAMQAGPPTEAHWCWNVPGTMFPGGEEGTGRRGPHWPLFGALFSQHPEKGLTYNSLKAQPWPPLPLPPSPLPSTLPSPSPSHPPSHPFPLPLASLAPGSSRKMPASPGPAHCVPAGQGDRARHADTQAGAWMQTRGSQGHGPAARALSSTSPPLRELWMALP